MCVFIVMADNLVNRILSNKRENIDSNINMINNQINNILDEIYRPYVLFHNNDLNKKKCLEHLLNNYQYYVSSDIFLVSGDYIRYISKQMKLGNNIYLKMGGFLLDEDDKNIRITNNNRIMKISKKDNYIFRKLTKNDIFRISISNSF